VRKTASGFAFFFEARWARPRVADELRRRPDHRQHAVTLRRREQIIEHRGVLLRVAVIVRSMIGDSESGATVSMPNTPSRSTTLAAPPPVVVTTATRAARGRFGGVRPARAARSR